MSLLRWTFLGLLLTAALPAVGQDDPPASAAVDLPDRPALIQSVWIQTVDDDSLVRLTVKLTWPKVSVETRFDGQATFVVKIPGTQPAPTLKGRLAVARQAVADLLLKPVGADTELAVRLNTPVRCRAYAVPSEKQIVIDCEFPEEPPKAEVGEPGEVDLDAPLTAEFIDTDIRVIIEALVSQTGANIMLQPGIVGSYSLSLRDITLTQALDALWEAWGLVWLELPGRIYLIGSEAELGQRRVDQKLELPAGWPVKEVWPRLAEQFPELRLTRSLESLAETGPLPVSGSLKVVGEARRWLARLPEAAEGESFGPPAPAREESLVYYPRHLTLTEARDAVTSEFAGVAVKLEEEAGRLTLSGPRNDVYRARRHLTVLDVPAATMVTEALWVPLVPAEGLRALAEIGGFELRVVHTSAAGSLIWVRGRETDLKALRALVSQLDERERRAREAERDQPPVGRP